MAEATRNACRQEMWDVIDPRPGLARCASFFGTTVPREAQHQPICSTVRPAASMKYRRCLPEDFARVGWGGCTQVSELICKSSRKPPMRLEPEGASFLVLLCVPCRLLQES